MPAQAPANSQQDSNKIATSAITLLDEGGALRSIGEQFAGSAVIGTGSPSMPIAASHRRTGFVPQLPLSSDSADEQERINLGSSILLPKYCNEEVHYGLW